ncbi:hypothetical protein [Pseudoalteromonas luteoviolacea]|uniref:hypothetical protein n=1 Tax=Pseudoalteromonas luteoviolacea TaxID=43657 RepID=UPI001B35B6B1|nr:hypothetical protein [Pseudoalteromonas luteoviolacea]MBQ4836051.1 hypothetical protein [Pseudoalteromonas luteoviolacea]
MATQKEVAAYFSVEDRTIRNWSKITGFPASKGRGGYCIQSISRWLATVAMSKVSSTQTTSSTLLEDEEKALKLAEKRLKIRRQEVDIKHKEFDLSIKEQRSAPIEIITRTLELSSVAASSNLKALLPRIKRAWHDIPPEAIEEINKVIATTCNEVANFEPDLSSYTASDLLSSEEGAESV